jgi:hypothetical protein
VADAVVRLTEHGDHRSLIDADQSSVCERGVGSSMAAFIYRCPNTRLRIQALAAEEVAEDADTYQPVTCIMCRQVHMVTTPT